VSERHTVREAAAAVIRLGVERGRTIAVAESLTGGAVTSTLVEVPGASAVLRGGVVAYATDLKASILEVPAELLAARGAVDPEVAAAMAVGVRRRCGADIGVATTGVAGPDPQDGKPVGLVYLAVAAGEAVRVAERRFEGDRAAVRAAAVEAAIGLLREALEAGESSPAAGS